MIIHNLCLFPVYIAHICFFIYIYAQNAPNSCVISANLTHMKLKIKDKKKSFFVFLCTQKDITLFEPTLKKNFDTMDTFVRDM